MKVYLGVNARDEKHIKEWIIHHLNLGFDKIYITDHMSKIPLSKELEPIKEHLIQFRENEESKHLKVKCMNNFLKYCQVQKVDWMVYLDADEFIVLNEKYKNIKEYIQSIPNEIPSIGIPWLLFGSNYLKRDPDDLIISSYTKCNNFFDDHTKGLNNVKYAKNATNPHFYHNTLNKYSNIFFNPLENWLFDKQMKQIKVEKVKDIPIFLAHYKFQSRESMFKRKLLLPRDDTGNFRDSPFNKKLSGKELEDAIISDIHSEWFNICNGVDCFYIKNKYSNEIKTKLEKYNWKY